MKIYNLTLNLNIFCHVLFEMISSYFRPYCRDCRDLRYMSFVDISKSREELSVRRGSRNMTSIYRPGPRPDAVTIWQGWVVRWWQQATFIIYIEFWSRDVFVPVIFFGGWLGDFRNLIFINAIRIVWYDNIPELGHELMEIDHLDHLFWVSKNLWVRLGRLGFGYWLGDFQKSIIRTYLSGEEIGIWWNICSTISMRLSSIEKIHFLIIFFLFGINRSFH